MPLHTVIKSTFKTLVKILYEHTYFSQTVIPDLYKAAESFVNNTEKHTLPISY